MADVKKYASNEEISPKFLKQTERELGESIYKEMLASLWCQD